MRGSPFLRTLIVLAALLVTGVGLMRLTAPAAASVPAENPEPVAGPSGKEARVIKVPFELTLSAEAESISLGGCMGAVNEGKTSGPVSGTFVTAEDEFRTILVNIRWGKDQSRGHRFAKLRLEPPGKPTLERVFDAPGDIDDIWLLSQ